MFAPVMFSFIFVMVVASGLALYVVLALLARHRLLPRSPLLPPAEAEEMSEGDGEEQVGQGDCCRATWLSPGCLQQAGQPAWQNADGATPEACQHALNCDQCCFDMPEVQHVVTLPPHCAGARPAAAHPHQRTAPPLRLCRCL
jgi:hypothetical protein